MSSDRDHWTLRFIFLFLLRARAFFFLSPPNRNNMSSNASYITVFTILVLALALFFNSNGNEHMARQTNLNNPASTPSFFDRQFTDIKGQPLNMDELRGKVLLLVNTASECGYTPQLHTLQELHDKYKERGFAVVVRV
jgi:hypothetical protein